MKSTKRKEYRINPKFVFEVDKTSRIFFFLPTVYWQPWKYRYEIGTEVVVDGKRVFITGLDVYINKKGKVTLIRAATKYGAYVTLEKSRKYRKNRGVYK